MGVGGSPFSGAQLATFGILFVAIVLGIVSLFTGWWVTRVDVGGQSDSADIKPFDDGNESSDALDSEVLITGVFALLAVLGLLGVAALEVLSALGRPVLPLYRWVALGATAAFGLTAVLYTALAWPEAGNANMGFFDKKSQTVDNPFAGSITIVLTTMAGIGWYFGIASMVLAPAGAAAIAYLNPSVPARPTAPPVPPIPAPTMTPTPTTPAPVKTAPVRAKRKT